MSVQAFFVADGSERRRIENSAAATPVERSMA